MTHGSLFSGIGGFDLAAEWMGWKNVFHCEWNEFGQKVLKHYWPAAISYHDITKTDFTIHNGKLRHLSGGFPCQGNSVAGLRLGTEDDRYLWPEMLRAIDEILPDVVHGENVTGIVSMEDKSGIYRDVFAKVESRRITRFQEVDYYEAVYTRQAKMLINSICEDLEKRGYQVQTFAIPAASVGAPHRRERIWFVAHRNSYDAGRCRYGEARETSTGCQNQEKEWQRFRDVIKRNGEERITSNSISEGLERTFGRISKLRLEQTPVIPDWENWPTQSPVCNGDDGLSTRLDAITFSKWRNESIKAGGNAIVPQVVYQIFQTIEAYEKEVAA